METPTKNLNSSDSLREQLKSVHKITKSSPTQSSVLKVLQDKVNELRIFKEKYYEIESKLKTAQESLKMQEAEFSFRETEHINEINNLKQIEARLREQITANEFELAKGAQRYEIQVKLELDNQKLLDKVDHKRSKIKQMRQIVNEKNSEIDTFKKNLQLNKNEIESLKNTIKNKNNEIEAVKKSIKIKDEEIEALNNTINGKLEKIQQLKQIITNNIDEISKYKNKISEQDSRIHKEKEKIKDMLNKYNQLNDLYEKSKAENIELKKLATRKQNQILKGKEMVEAKYKSILNHIEAERDSIYDLLTVDPEDINGNWTNLFDKCKLLINQNAQYSEIENNSEKLKKRLSIALEENRENRRLLNQQKPKEEYDELVDNLRLNLHKSECEIDLLNKQLEKMSLRNKFASLVEYHASRFTKQMNELHEYIFQTDTSIIRGIILAVVFTKRLIRVFRGNSIIDIKALQVFQGRNSESTELKLRDLRDKFVQFTEDILVAKQNYVDSENNKREIIAENKEIKKKLNLSNNGNQEHVKAILLLKNRVYELQQELSTMISPDEYDKMRRRAEKAESNELMQYNKTNFLRQYNSSESYNPSPDVNLISYEVECNLKSEEINHLKSIIRNYEKEIESLKVLVNEKTKEVLSLERLVNRHDFNEKTNKANLTCISKENQVLNEALQTTRIHEPEPVTLFTGKTYGLSTRINPVFLGQ